MTADEQNDPHKDHRRRITNALAELDLMFSIGETQSWGRGWQLVIEGEPKKGAPNPVSIMMVFFGENHLAAIATVSRGPTPLDKLPALLELNTHVVTAKVAMDTGGQVAVWASIHVDRLDTATIDDALQAVVAGADRVHDILRG